MNHLDVQRLMSAAGYYRSGLDGVIGRAHRTAVDKILANNASLLSAGHERWTADRRSVAAGQVILDRAGFEPGNIDGYTGHNTTEAMAAYDFEKLHGQREVVERVAIADRFAARINRPSFPHQRDVARFYGSPGPSVEQKLVRVTPPFRTVLAWAPQTRLSSIRIHEKCTDSLDGILQDVYRTYGDRIPELGLDLFGGSYNHRKMRGGSSWSMHAYGCAIDWHPQPNGLRTPCPQALFCRPEYRDMLDIYEAHGWTCAIRAWGKDAMHFQAAGF